MLRAVHEQWPVNYLVLLQRYMHSVRARNALLKARVTDEAALESFSAELVKLGNEIIRARRELVPKFSPLARLAYRRISNDAEELRIEYTPALPRARPASFPDPSTISPARTSRAVP